MLGDTAVAVHPDDERYRAPRSADACGCRSPSATSRSSPTSYVDPAFGSGCVKITPAHDFNDYEIGQRHDLPLINIFTPTRGAQRRRCRERFRGLDRFEARKRIVAELEARGPHRAHREAPAHGAARRSQRRGARALPHRPVVRADRAARGAGDRRGRERAARASCRRTGTRTYFEWMRNIKDWCISRQLWWGHRIPAWYDADGNIYVGRERGGGARAARGCRRELRAAPGRGRARHLVLLGAVAVLDARLARAHAASSRASTRPACWSPASTSSSSGSRA